ncbi:MAG: AAA family ATPase [Rhodobacteraceae bacterium]|nr:AAA family ATPase [Paracoccaceae bacterium]
MADFEQPYWDQFAPPIISSHGLKKHGKEYKGPCPACGGDDRFWIANHNGLVKVHCRVCGDWKSIIEQLHAEGLWPSLQPIRDNVVQLRNEDDFPVQEGQTYNERKGVRLFNAWVENQTVVVPLYNFERERVGYQSIAPDGRKRFNKGLDKSQGVFGVCGTIDGPVCYVAEGWATSASVAEATNEPCVFALSCHDMPLVCQKLRQMFPDINFIIAADADRQGREAAAKTGMPWAAPKTEGSDWNDVHQAMGKEAVTAGLKMVAQPKPLFVALDQIEVKKPQWLIEDLLEQDSLAIVFGASGTFKTFVVIDMALSVATGKDYHGRDVHQGAVVFIAGEGNYGFSRRTAAWFRHYDLEQRGIPFLKSAGGIVLSEDRMEEITQHLDAAQAHHGKLDLICLDTLDRTIEGVEDNNDDTKRYLDFCDQLRVRYATTVLVVAHTGHQAPNRAKGSTKLKDRMDASYQVRAWGDNNVDLIPRKMKDAEEPSGLTFIRVPITVETFDGEETDSLVLSLVHTEPQEGLSKERFHSIILDNFERQKQDGRMKQADLKQLVATDTNTSQKTVQRRIKELIDDKVFRLDGRDLCEGDSYVQNAF